MKDWNIKEDKAQNAIYLKEDNGGKGRFFRARFLQPGLVKYSFGVCLLTKEVIDKFVYKFVGCPVVIDHKDVTDESAKDMRVGVISKVDFDPFDAWYWCEGVIFDQEAIDLVNDGYNVSCQYEITQYATNDKEELHNGNPYDKEILDGAPEHLAIVKNPRYENAMIAVNAIDVNAENILEEIIEKTEEKESEAEIAQNSTDFVAEFKDTLYTVLAEGIANRLGELIASNEDNDKEGRWITTKGQHIFIPKGKKVEDVVKEHWENIKSEADLEQVRKKDKWNDEDFKTFAHSLDWLKHDSQATDEAILSYLKDLNINNYKEYKKEVRSHKFQMTYPGMQKHFEMWRKNKTNKKDIKNLDKQIQSKTDNIEKLKTKEKELEKKLEELRGKRENITSKYKNYQELEKSLKNYLEPEPPDYKITDIETTAKDLGITKESPKIIKTPLGEERITWGTIDHLYTRKDKTRPKSINKMINTLENPHIVNEIDSKKYYFKIFSNEDKTIRDLSIASPEGEIITNIPIKRGNWIFNKILSLGKTIYNILDNKKDVREE